MVKSNIQRVLRPGEDYSLWPHMKWARARQLASELYSSIQLQSASSRAGFDVVIAEDRLSATFLVRENASPPLHEWSILLGDILHNYRSALDALAWELAHLDGNVPEPKYIRQIYFPICLTLDEWSKKAGGALSSVPEDILVRLRAVQPFHVEPVDKGIFVTLHRLDIEDKHKGQLRAELFVRDHATVRYAFRLEGGAGASGEGLDSAIEWLSGGSPLRVGQEAFRINSAIPIEMAESDMPIPLELSVSHDESRIDVFQLIDLIEQQCSQSFHLIQTGEYMADQP